VSGVSGGVLVPWAVFVLAAAGVAVLQPRLAQAAHKAGEREAVYSLPPPGQLHAATLGWDAAAVDGLWAKVLVEYGEHWADHRPFEDTGRYADAILEIEPSYRPLFKIIDTMLVYRPMQGTQGDARAARAYLERGLHEYPDDAQMWLRYGEFLAYTGTSFLSDPKEQEVWREDGARAMEHGVELGASPDRALTAANIFSKAGQIEVALESLKRAYAFTEHPSMVEVHEAIARKIEILQQQLGEASGPPPPEPP
jgi:tetratricopeptide (TPR) repeat protein